MCNQWAGRRLLTGTTAAAAAGEGCGPQAHEGLRQLCAVDVWCSPLHTPEEHKALTRPLRHTGTHPTHCVCCMCWGGTAVIAAAAAAVDAAAVAGAAGGVVMAAAAAGASIVAAAAVADRAAKVCCRHYTIYNKPTLNKKHQKQQQDSITTRVGAE